MRGAKQRETATRGDRVKAGDACAANGWRSGVVLSSTEWVAARRIHSVDCIGVELYCPKAQRRYYVTSLPRDVAAAMTCECGGPFAGGLCVKCGQDTRRAVSA